MSHNWILDVLADLKAYARKNDLTALAEQLDDTRHVAVAELAQRSALNGLVCIEGGDPAGAPHDARAGGAV
jgi:hypothetical protein